MHFFQYDLNGMGMDKEAWFPHQFFDIASTYLPRDIKKTFQWCEYIYFNNGAVRSATERIAQYFVTEIKAVEEKANSNKLVKILNKKKKDFLLRAIDTLIYGNSFATIYFPIERLLVCPACNFQANASMVGYKFRNYEFHSSCKCGYSGKFNVIDNNAKEPEKINIIRLDPKNMVVYYNCFSGESKYFWVIPTEISDSIKSTSVSNYERFILNTVPLEVIDSIKEGKDFEFNSSRFSHMKNLSIAGVSCEWGFPLYLNLMKLNFYNMILRRANETIALDFCVPFRVMSPASSAGVDPLSIYNMGGFVSEMETMIQQHRVDPATIKIAPFPITYQAFGAEKKSLDLTADIEQNNAEMMDGLNFPMEFYKNQMNMQAMPSFLRLFENTWEHLVSGLNEQLQWTADHICDFMGWERNNVTFTKVTLADDMEKKQILLQLASAQQVSWNTALRPYNINFVDEQANIANQQREVQKIMEEAQKKATEDQMISESPQQGMGAPGDILGQADAEAQRMLSMPYEQRRAELANLKQQNPLLHAMTSQLMDDYRGKSQSDQGRQFLAQMGMGGSMMNPQGQMMPPPSAQGGM